MQSTMADNENDTYGHEIIKICACVSRMFYDVSAYDILSFDKHRCTKQRTTARRMVIYIAHKICNIPISILAEKFERPKSIFYRAIAEFEKEMHDNCRLAAIVREFESVYKSDD